MLADFDFVLVHKPGSTNTRADPLSRLSVHEVTDSDDNREQIVLKPEHFRIVPLPHLTKTPNFSMKYVIALNASPTSARPLLFFEAKALVVSLMV